MALVAVLDASLSRRRLLQSARTVEVVTRVYVNNLDKAERVKVLLRQAYTTGVLLNNLRARLPALSVRALAPHRPF